MIETALYSKMKQLSKAMGARIEGNELRGNEYTTAGLVYGT